MYVGYLTSQTVGASSPYVFTTKYITNNNIRYNSANGVLTFLKPGWYEIQFDTSAGGVGDITPTLVLNGTASTYALADMSSTANAVLVNGAFSTIVYVSPAPNFTFSTLQIVNKGVSAETITANLIVKRIG